MPIEIKELTIRAIVAPQSSERKDMLDRATLEKVKREIVKECLQEVKMLLNEHKER